MWGHALLFILKKQEYDAPVELVAILIHLSEVLIVSIGSEVQKKEHLQAEDTFSTLQGITHDWLHLRATELK